MAGPKLGINDVFPDGITKIDRTLLPVGWEGDSKTARAIQEVISVEINYIGELSAREQALKKIVTSVSNLQQAETHFVYLLNDKNSDNGKGEIIGMLKIGYKHLYMFEDGGKIHEIEPLCILDFFVLPNHQRQGCGIQLMNYMLKDTNSIIHAMPIDGPSPCMEKFLGKYYDIKKLKKQSNNFSITESFFKVYIKDISKNGLPMHRKPTVAAGRQTISTPGYTASCVIHEHYALQNNVYGQFGSKRLHH